MTSILREEMLWMTVTITKKWKKIMFYLYLEFEFFSTMIHCFDSCAPEVWIPEPIDDRVDEGVGSSHHEGHQLKIVLHLKNSKCWYQAPTCLKVWTASVTSWHWCSSGISQENTSCLSKSRTQSWNGKVQSEQHTLHHRVSNWLFLWIWLLPSLALTST